MGERDERDRISSIESLVRDEQRLGKLVGRANRMLRESGYGKCERAETAVDIVFQLLNDALTNGPRKWDRKKVPNVDTWVASQLRSVVWNIVKKHNRPISAGIVAESKNARGERPAMYNRPLASLDREMEEKGFDPPDSRDCIKEYEQHELVATLRNRLEDELLDSIVLDGVLNGDTNREIASDLVLEVKEVENAKKRIKRKLDRILRELGDQ